ncbi:Uncharacterized protein OBRU01_08226, partial [Operophtera brumata]
GRDARERQARVSSVRAAAARARGSGMAPALPLAPREPPDLSLDALEPAHRRPVLAPVDNLSEDDVMGLQNHPNIMKDPSPLGDQMLVDLSGNDLLSVIKTLETNNDPLSTGDAESIFPLDLPEAADSESDPPEQKVMLTQVRIERRCSFLLRRLRILQARALGKRIAEEAAQTFEKSTRGARKDGGGRPIGLKALLKRVETTATLQANAASRSVVGPKYYNAGTSRGDASKSASVGISSGTLAGLEDTAGALKSHLSVVKHELDSDATASSSGAESNDEAVKLMIVCCISREKRALWTWQRERASIASRWCWLQAQVQELDYKIRQHKELHKTVREAKGPIEFEGEPVGYEGSLPGSDAAGEDPALETCLYPIESCAVCTGRPEPTSPQPPHSTLSPQQRLAALDPGYHPVLSDIKGTHYKQSCAVCTGRPEPTSPQPPHSTLSPQQRLAALDPGYHPVLSDIKGTHYKQVQLSIPHRELRDVAPSTHMAALCSRSWFRPRVVKPAARGAPRHSPHAPHAPHAPHTTHEPYPPPKPPKKHLKRRRQQPAADTGVQGDHHAQVRPCLYTLELDNNIVIPQSVAANNRAQILEYKDIITPKASPPTTGRRYWSTRRSSRPKRRRQQPAADTGVQGDHHAQVRPCLYTHELDNNIVIPQSVAANNRPQILEYKEIITPKYVHAYILTSLITTS